MTTGRQIAKRNAELILALIEIAKKRKLDAVAAASMQAIAIAALNAAGVRTGGGHRKTI